MGEPRTLVWWSTGAASYVAAVLTLRRSPDALLVRCETGNEDEDNIRFEKEAMRSLGKSVTILMSEKYGSVWDVWQSRRFMSGPDGAPCTGEMKVAPRVAFQRPDDVHVFGYTADREDVARFARLQKTYFEMTVRAPLIEAGVTKQGALAIVEREGLSLPRSYAMGFPNANCLQTGCSKATSPNYWALYRKHFPDNFVRTAGLAREIGARLTRIEGERRFIDEIPADWPTVDPIVPACDFLCVLAEGGPDA